MTTPNPISDPAVQAALQAIADAGLDSVALLDAYRLAVPGTPPLAPNGRPVPTVAEYMPVVMGALEKTSYFATWKPHLEAFRAAFGDHLVTYPNTDDCRDQMDQAGEAARKRRPNSRNDGHGAEENNLNATRYFFNRVRDAGYRLDNPAARLKRPARRKNARRGLEADELRDLFTEAISGGDDPELDGLLIRTTVECGARREGLINLTLAAIDRQWCRVELDEKFGIKRWVPITAELADALIEHAHRRGATRPDDKVLRYRPKGNNPIGAPLSTRRLDTLFSRIRAELPWAAREGVSLHWLRHTAATAIERIAGQAVAAAYLGHEHPGTTTLNYTRAVAREVCNAFSVYTGFLHPMADPAAVEALRHPHGPVTPAG